VGRRSVFGRSQISGAALRLVADRGPQAVTVAALAKEVGAPTGSIYHRYRSREQLLAELWMDVVESFQNRFAGGLAQSRDLEGGIAMARLMVTWTREHALEARLLLLHRRQDFVSGDWPEDLAARAAGLEPQLGSALRGYADRAFGRTDAETMARLRYALLDAPFGALRPYVQSQKRLPAIVDELVVATARAVLTPIATGQR
jgi:AcrR family transcriptional regulator